MDSLTIQRMTSAHIDNLTKIEQTSRENYWNAQVFEKHLRTRNCAGMIIRDSMAVIGFIAYEHSLNGYVQIWNMVIEDRFRRNGCGTRLIEQMKSWLPHKFDGLCFNVRESNLEAQLFLKKLGFWCEAIALNYFVDKTIKKVRQENAYCFDYNPMKRREKSVSVRIIDRLGDDIDESRYRRKSFNVAR